MFANEIIHLISHKLRKHKRLIYFLTLILAVKLILSATNSPAQTFSNRVRLVVEKEVNTSNYIIEFKDLERRLEPKKKDLDQISIQNEIKTIIPNQRAKHSLLKQNYVIVEYTKIFDSSKYCTNPSQESIYLSQCPYKNCLFTCDKRKAFSADALLFHEADLVKLSIEESIFLMKYLNDVEFRKEQIWILWNDEPNVNTDKINRYKFNWTLTYRIDGELADCSYGCAYKNYFGDQLYLERAKLVDGIKNEFIQRKKQALWFVSNCDAKTRIKIGLLIAKTIPIRVFGRCNHEIEYMRRYDLFRLSVFHKLDIFIRNIIGYMPSNNAQNCKRGSDCERKEFSESKFYFSFESKNCTSYITEKLWRILDTRMIPVVFQPAKEFYELVAPADSFIHADDFDSFEDLAKHLDLVASSFDVYLKYHLWRLDYSIAYKQHQTEPRRMCELCTKLNTETSVIYYDKVYEWFNYKCYSN